MCTPHIRVDTVSYDSILETLTRGLATSLDHLHEQDYPRAAGYLRGAVQSAIICLEVHRENCSFAEGYTSPEIQSMSDQAALLGNTYGLTFDYSEKPELQAEVTPELVTS